MTYMNAAEARRLASVDGERYQQEQVDRHLERILTGVKCSAQMGHYQTVETVEIYNPKVRAQVFSRLLDLGYNLVEDHNDRLEISWEETV